MSRDVLAALPRGATGLSVVCDCHISGSYSLTIFVKKRKKNIVLKASEYDQEMPKSIPPTNRQLYEEKIQNIGS